MNRAHPMLAALAISTVTTATALVAGSNVALAGAQTDIVAPAGSGEFGYPALVLSNGNYVVVDPLFDKAGVADVGAVYLYNGATRQLISTLTGSTAGDRIGEFEVDEVGNSNFVVLSPDWTNASGAPIVKVGAVTWVSGTTGLNGVVSPANSLVGAATDDAFGSRLTVLSNGNFAAGSPGVDFGGQIDVGAVTWGAGNGPTTGVISPVNSLLGSTTDDHVSDVITPLTNGNFVASTPSWDDIANAHTDAGAATWLNGSDAGPRTVGHVSTGNSLWGPANNSAVASNAVLPLSNGNYVVLSPEWDLGVTQNVGAATLANGATGTTGFVGASNSLHGSTLEDRVAGDAAALTNGNYVIGSEQWDDTVGGHTNAGAATWRSGATAAVLGSGTVTQANSLYGPASGDNVSGEGITALTNGNYVVQSTTWHNGTVADAGAATWADGDTGLSGPVSVANSLVGTVQADQVGDEVDALTNGNYVVSTTSWNDGGTPFVGAVTWANGDTGLVASVTAANSLVGSSPMDFVGASVVGLTNGNYVVTSYDWNGQRGAVTWGSGTGGLVGTIDDTNSLVGDQPGDLVGYNPATPLANGNYVVNSPRWQRGTIVDAGASTFGDGAAGVAGHVSAVNSLLGAATGDRVGTYTLALPDGSYAVSSNRNNGTTLQAGSITFGLPTGVRGELTPANTVFGTAAMSAPFASNRYASDGSLLIGRPKSNLITLYKPDRTAPVFQTPANVTVTAPSGATSTVVTYPLPVATDDVGNPTVACTPPPGTAFPTGATTVTCTATNTEGLTTTTSFTVTVGGDYVPVAPVRLADSRSGGTTIDGLFAGQGLRPADSTLQLRVAGRGGVPADALAVTLNVTVTEATAPGFLTVYPCDEPRPTASNVNYEKGSTIPNAVITKLAADASSKGDVCIYVQQTVHVVVDVNGFFPPTTSYHSINPARVLDSRVGMTTIDGSQQGTGAAAAGSVTTLQIGGRAGVPNDAAAVVLNVTITEPTAAGYATVYPCGTEPPTASNLNYTPGQTIPNLVIAKIGTGGDVCIYTQSTTQLVADVLGYFPIATTYGPLVPARLLDSRPAATTIDSRFAGSGAIPLGTVTVVHVLGRGGVPANATTAVLNVTVTEPTAPGYVTVYPCGIEPPLASNLNFVAGQTIPNAVLTKIGTNGDVCVYNSQATHLIVDVAGLFG